MLELYGTGLLVLHLTLSKNKARIVLQVDREDLQAWC